MFYINIKIECYLFTEMIDCDKSFRNWFDVGGFLISFDVDSEDVLRRNNKRLFLVLLRFHPS